MCDAVRACSQPIWQVPALFTFALIVLGASAQQSSSAAKQNSAVQVEMRNVSYHYTDRVAVHIKTLSGELAPIGSHEFPIFDDKRSFKLRITTAEIGMSAESLANVLNSYVLTRRDTPLKDINIRIEHGRLKIKGKLHNQGDLPFETEGVLSATPDGKVRLHSEKIKTLHLPVKGLMDLFGIEIADLIKAGKSPGMQAEKDDLILDPQQILPAPHIEGAVTEVQLRGDSIVQIFGRPERHQPRGVPAQNYMAYTGNRLQFGKLIMSDTDMILIDMDPNDPFDFYLDHYQEQLAAGYTQITPNFGLRVYMRDFDKLRGGKSARKTKRQ